MSDPRVYLCLSNEERRFVNIAFENILVELKLRGKSPLVISVDGHPFSSIPAATPQKEGCARYLEHYTGAQVPSIRLAELAEHFSDAKKRNQFISEEEKFSDVFLYGGLELAENLAELADELVLFIKKDASSASWVYGIVKQLAEKNILNPLRTIVMNASMLEEAVIFFFGLKEEIGALLGRSVNIAFDGFIRFDFEHLNAALSSGKTIVEIFKGGQFHGFVKYMLANLSKSSPAGRSESFFHRLASYLDAKK